MNSLYRQLIPNQEIDRRITEFQAVLAREHMDGALIVQKADRFYYTGTTQQGWLYVPVLGEPLFMVFKDEVRARAESGLKNILPLMSPKKIPGVIKGQGTGIPARLGLELDVMPANTYLMFKEIFDTSDIRDISGAVRLQRAVKSGFEIDCIQKACELADEVAAQVPELVKEGMSEIELAGLLEAHARKLGHQGTICMRLWDNHLFYGHIMCGPDAAVPGALSSPTAGPGLNPFVGQGPSFNTIVPNQPLLVDYVFALDGYLADHARIFSLGELDDEFHQAHGAMLEIQETIKGMARPGAVTGEIYETMVTMAADRGYADRFMGGAHPRIRFTGHGLGIELDEFPFIAKGQDLVLAEGMVFALEPKVIMPGKGVAGIENTFLVTRDGLKALTRYPDRVMVI